MIVSVLASVNRYYCNQCSKTPGVWITKGGYYYHCENSSILQDTHQHI